MRPGDLPRVALGPAAAQAGRFRRSEISEALRNKATIDGVNVEFNGGKVRLLANYISQKIGTPSTRRGQLITQAQVKF